MRTYWEDGEEYKFNREAFQQFIDTFLGRSRDGKKSRHALFEEWESKYNRLTLDSLNHWYSPNFKRRSDPNDLEIIKLLGETLKIDYHLLLTKLRKEGEKTDMSMEKILEQNERIESKIDSIIELLKRVQSGSTPEDSLQECTDSQK